jgi:UDP-N-acetylglucosamine/UDP-N-acetylgalactosamine diphosphorylase
MLNQPPIFLGGQGGIIGPLRLGYGNVVAAGSILRHDYPQDNQLIFEKAPANSLKDYVPETYHGIGRIVENNILYLANLTALEAWYTHVRKPFLEAQPLGHFLYAGVIEQLAAAKKERLKRLKAMAEKAIVSSTKKQKGASTRKRQELHEQIGEIEELFTGKMPEVLATANKARDPFLNAFNKAVGNDRSNYISTIQGLPAAISSKGVIWLNGIVNAFGEKVAESLPSMGLFQKNH